MGYIRDIRAAFGWIDRKEREMVGKFTPEGQKRYRRWKRFAILVLIQRKVTGIWPWPL